jgi:23S rRNA pseudouridine2457 synthase
VILAFNKPYGILSRFTSDGSSYATLAGFGFPPEVYPLGRLDADSEGLLLLTDEGQLNRRLLHPDQRHAREYWAQVERQPDAAALRRLSEGVMIDGERTRPCRAWVLEPQPGLPERVPPIRFRKTVPTCWLGLELVEGRNRQVRRMTAAVGHPTLRLIRVRVGRFHLGELAPGRWIVLGAEKRRLLFSPRGFS